MVSNAELIIPHYWESLSKSDFEMGMNLQTFEFEFYKVLTEFVNL